MRDEDNLILENLYSAMKAGAEQGKEPGKLDVYAAPQGIQEPGNETDATDTPDPADNQQDQQQTQKDEMMRSYQHAYVVAEGIVSQAVEDLIQPLGLEDQQVVNGLYHKFMEAINVAVTGEAAKDGIPHQDISQIVNVNVNTGANGANGSGSGKAGEKKPGFMKRMIGGTADAVANAPDFSA